MSDPPQHDVNTYDSRSKDTSWDFIISSVSSDNWSLARLPTDARDGAHHPAPEIVGSHGGSELGKKRKPGDVSDTQQWLAVKLDFASSTPRKLREEKR